MAVPLRVVILKPSEYTSDGYVERPVRHDLPEVAHPNFSREQLTDLLFRCYRKFFSSGHAVIT